MTDCLNIHQICRAADVSRTQLNQWISRGYFTPAEVLEKGKARSFSYTEAVSLAVFAELARLGIPYDVASRQSVNLYGFNDDQALLVLYQGSVDAVTSRGGKKMKLYFPDTPVTMKKIIPLKKFAEMASNPDVRSMAVVNLNHIDARVKASIDSEAADE